MLGFVLGRRRVPLLGIAGAVAAPSPPPAVPSSPPPAAAPPTGFAANGAANTALRAMLARVANSSGRGRIVVKGDSTSMGAGAGSNAALTYVPGSRRYRVSAVLAQELAGIGRPALDNGVVGDNGSKGFGGLPAYDDRVVIGGDGWVNNGGQNFAGGNFQQTGSGTYDFTPGVAVDTFVIDFYNLALNLAILIDGGAPAAVTTSGGATAAGGVVTVPNTGVGFSRAVVSASAPGSHTLRLSGGGGVIKSVHAYSRSAAAIDILNHASGGATSAQQAAADPTNHWWNNDALAFEAPDLTIVDLGLNDAAIGTAPQAYAANLQAIVATARLSGDVLIVSPHPVSSAFASAATLAALRDAAAALAASKSVAYLDLSSWFGSYDAIASRLPDGVHGNAGFYAEVGGLYRRCIEVMTA